MNRKAVSTLLAFTAIAAMSVPAAFAAPIIAPVAVSGSSPDPFGRDPSNLIDQAILFAPYVSGVTDFDTYVPSTLATYVNSDDLGAIGGVAGGFFQFDMGAAYDIDAIAIWNQLGSGSLDAFHLEASNAADFSSSIALGSFTMSVFGGARPIAADVFAFSPVAARYFRINVDSNAGFPDATIINEVVFRQAEVPEPSSLLLLGVGLLSAMGTRRRQH